MRLRTLLTLLTVILLAMGPTYLIHQNQAVVVVRLGVVPPLAVQLWLVMMSSFLAGAAIILLFDIAGGARRFAHHRKAQKLHRAHEKTEDLYRHGLQDLENGRSEPALAKFEEVLAREPYHVNALVKRGDSLRTLRRYREAVASLEQVIRLSPDHLIALYHLSDVYLETGDQPRAEEVLRRILRLDPKTTVSAHRKLRDLKMRQKDWVAADELQGKIESMLTVPREKDEARVASMGIRFELACDHLNRGEVKQAIQLLGTVLKRDERFVPAYCRLGQAHQAAGNHQEAIATWKRGYQMTGSPEVLQTMEEYYLEQELPEDAIAVWKDVLRQATDEAPLRYCLGKLYHRLFMLEEALREFRIVEERVTSLPALHIHVAKILESQGDLRGALGECESLVDKVRDDLMDYRCSACEKRFSRWTDFCDQCNRWNTVALDVRAVAVPEPTIRPGPTWSIP